MHCPCCNTELTRMDLGAFGLVLVSRCDSCAGTWFDSEQAGRFGEQVVAEIASTPDAEPEERPAVPCPRCAGGAMSAVTPVDAKDMVAHRCGGCGGFWMDRAQLDKLTTLDADDSSRVIDRKSVESRPTHWSALRWIGWRLKRCFE